MSAAVAMSVVMDGLYIETADEVRTLRLTPVGLQDLADVVAAALAQARADRALLAGLWLGAVPHDVLPTLLPTDQGDRDRLAAALDAADRQTGAEARTAAGRAVIARIVAEMGGGAA